MRAVRKPSQKRSSNRKPTLSPTRIATYLECAVKYRYIYSDKIGRFYMRARSGYSFGSTLHHVLQEFHAQGGSETAEEMVASMEQGWIAAGYKSEEEERIHREAGQEIVQAYHHAHQERRDARIETIATEKTITCDMGPFKLSGRVDRIDRHPDGSLEIIDYKSGRWDVTSEEVASSLAMSCYQLIVRRLYSDTPVFATIYSLRSGIQASSALEGEALEEFNRDILALGEQIINTDFTELMPVPLSICPECDFYSLCKRFWHKQKEAEIFPDSPFAAEE